MSYPKRPARQQAEEYCKEYPNHGDQTIAKKLFKEFPEMYPTLDNARDMVRVIRGHKGKMNREQASNKELFKPITNNPNAFDIPDSVEENWEPFVIQQSKGLIISDIHIPYHSVEALTAALNYGKDRDVNFILINGDLLDMPNHSRFEKDWRNRSTFEEFQAGRQFLAGLRKGFPRARIIFKEGNHDERWERWLYVKAPEIFDDPEFKLETRLKLGELGIEIVKDRRPIKIGKLNVLHGHEMFGGSGGVNPARSAFLKTLSNLLIGHFHKRSSNDEPTLDGHMISVESTACLCGLHPLYARVNKWGHGFALVEHDLKTGEYLLDNRKIINGKAY